MTRNLSMVIRKVLAERERQDAKHGGAEHDDQHTSADWLRFIREHTEKAQTALEGRDGNDGESWRDFTQTADFAEYEQRLLEVAALSLAALESHYRKLRAPETADFIGNSDVTQTEIKIRLMKTDDLCEIDRLFFRGARARADYEENEHAEEILGIIERMLDV